MESIARANPPEKKPLFLQHSPGCPLLFPAQSQRIVYPSSCPELFLHLQPPSPDLEVIENFFLKTHLHWPSWFIICSKHPDAAREREGKERKRESVFAGGRSASSKLIYLQHQRPFQSGVQGSWSYCSGFGFNGRYVASMGLVNTWNAGHEGLQL